MAAKLLFNQTVIVSNMNGILAEVQGQYVAAGIQSLPSAERAEKKEHAVELDAGHAGRVIIYYERKQVRHHKHSHWYWSACRAERVEAL